MEGGGGGACPTPLSISACAEWEAGGPKLCRRRAPSSLRKGTDVEQGPPGDEK